MAWDYSPHDKIEDLRDSVIDWDADEDRANIAHWWASMNIDNKFQALAEIARLRKTLEEG